MLSIHAVFKNIGIREPQRRVDREQRGIVGGTWVTVGVLEVCHPTREEILD
jgi:hypothetical protein